jgi:hypothetical protein
MPSRCIDRSAHARELAREQDQHHAQIADDREQQPAQAFGAAGTAARGVQGPDFLGCLLAIDQVANSRAQALAVGLGHGDAGLLQSMQGICGKHLGVGVEIDEQVERGDEFLLGRGQGLVAADTCAGFVHERTAAERGDDVVALQARQQGMRGIRGALHAAILAAQEFFRTPETQKPADAGRRNVTAGRLLPAAVDSGIDDDAKLLGRRLGGLAVRERVRLVREADTA